MRPCRNKNMTKLEAKNLTVTYTDKKLGDTVAVNKINTVFQSGEFSVILGQSGSGKTSLIRALSGLQEYEGEILYDGIDADNIPFRKRNIAYVTQNYSLYSHLNVFDNIAFPLKTIGASREEIIERVLGLADQLDISVCLNRKPRQLSGGQQQKVALARALIKKPSICFMDEPLSNIDPKQRDRVRALMKKTLKLNGCTVIYITHDYSEAVGLADRIFVMDKGRIIACGTPEEINLCTDERIQPLKGGRFI